MLCSQPLGCVELVCVLDLTRKCKSKRQLRLTLPQGCIGVNLEQMLLMSRLKLLADLWHGHAVSDTSHSPGLRCSLHWRPDVITWVQQPEFYKAGGMLAVMHNHVESGVITLVL